MWPDLLFTPYPHPIIGYLEAVVAGNCNRYHGVRLPYKVHMERRSDWKKLIENLFGLPKAQYGRISPAVSQLDVGKALLGRFGGEPFELCGKTCPYDLQGQCR